MHVALSACAIVAVSCSFPDYSFVPTLASAGTGGAGASGTGGAGASGVGGQRVEGGTGGTNAGTSGTGTGGAPDFCADGRVDGSETAVDCGGTCDAKCADGAACSSGGDCMSGVCGAGQTCSAPTCTDHVKNGKESDVDCGGRACSQCPALGTCDADSSCQSGVCTNGRCDAGLVVHYVTQTPGASETRVIPEIHLVNNGKNAVSLASLSLRYYFTVNGEDSTSVQVTQTSANTTGSAGGDITGVTSWMVVSIPPVFEADTYLSVSFPTATTSLAPGDTATIYSTLTFVDSGPMVQTNDYSFDAAATLDQPYDHIPVYSGTSLIYGVPPGQ